MGKMLESSAERRLQSFRRELVLDLFTRHGLFWGAVSWVRERRGIEAVVAMPPPLDPRRVHLPPGVGPTDRHWSPAELQAYREWSVLLRVLHDEVVPAGHRVEGPTSSSVEFWGAFLSACLLYDPPADGLLPFADHGVAAFGEFVNPLNPWAEEGKAPQMLAPPIRFLPDAEVLLRAQEERYLRLIDLLHERLAPGVDVWELVSHIEYWNLPDDSVGPDPATAAKQRPRPYIDVDVHTTDADVRNAFKLMAAALPRRPRPIRPKRDRLIALQCAILYQEFGWSQKRLAEHFGWAVQDPPGAKSKSETARQYIADGRDLLDQRKPAA